MSGWKDPGFYVDVEDFDKILAENKPKFVGEKSKTTS